MARAKGPPPPSDPDAGIWHGRSVARRVVSPDGMVILVGRTAADNDVLSLKLASPKDFWFHVSGESGSHVVVRNPDGLDTLPRDTKRLAAGLAAGYSKGARGGRLAVHMARCRYRQAARCATGRGGAEPPVTVRSDPLRLDEIAGEEVVE
jgi:hypothetical protein